MITEKQFQSMSRTLSHIVDCESSVRLLQERVKFASSLNNDDLLDFISDEIQNTINIIDKKIFDDLLNQRLAATNLTTPDNSSSDSYEE